MSPRVLCGRNWVNGSIVLPPTSEILSEDNNPALPKLGSSSGNAGLLSSERISLVGGRTIDPFTQLRPHSTRGDMRHFGRRCYEHRFQILDGCWSLCVSLRCVFSS